MPCTAPRQGGSGGTTERGERGPWGSAVASHWASHIVETRGRHGCVISARDRQGDDGEVRDIADKTS